MSSDDFFGRTLRSGKSSFRFELCEICLQKSSNWIEIKGSKGDGYVIRITCDACHEDFDKEEINAELYSRQMEDGVEITEHSRPGWVDDFIKNSDNLQSIDLDTQEEMGSKKEKKNWVKEFIDETLFGSDPVNWMEMNNLFKLEEVDENIDLLAALSLNELSSVKLSSLACLNAIFIRHRNLKEKIVKSIELFLSDENEVVLEYVNELLGRIKNQK